MTDLVTWLRAQLAAVERAAAAAVEASGEQCWSANGNLYGATQTNNTIAVGPWGAELDEVAEHMARHDPARVLAEVEAKRRILDLHDGSHECSTLRRDTDWDGNPTEEVDSCTWVAEGTCTTVQLLALPYADQEGYREEWRP